MAVQSNLDREVQEMFDEIRHPEKSKYIYERAEINGVPKYIKENLVLILALDN